MFLFYLIRKYDKKHTYIVRLTHVTWWCILCWSPCEERNDGRSVLILSDCSDCSRARLGGPVLTAGEASRLDIAPVQDHHLTAVRPITQ